MNRNTWIGTGVVMVCGVVAAVALGGSVSKTATFAEVMKSKDQCEVYGKLDKRSIQPIRGGNLVRFTLADEHSPQRMEVLYDNATISLPANFPAASHAKVSGFYDAAEHRFKATSVMTKCPSKYSEKDGPTAEETKLVEKWQRETGQESAKL